MKTIEKGVFLDLGIVSALVPADIEVASVINWRGFARWQFVYLPSCYWYSSNWNTICYIARPPLPATTATNGRALSEVNLAKKLPGNNNHWHAPQSSRPSSWLFKNLLLNNADRCATMIARAIKLILAPGAHQRWSWWQQSVKETTEVLSAIGLHSWWLTQSTLFYGFYGNGWKIIAYALGELDPGSAQDGRTLSEM